jgi:hypothetical protein
VTRLSIILILVAVVLMGAPPYQGYIVEGVRWALTPLTWPITWALVYTVIPAAVLLIVLNDMRKGKFK